MLSFGTLFVRRFFAALLVGALSVGLASAKWDLDGNGNEDLVWQKGDGTLDVWLMNGLAASTSAQSTAASGAWRVTHQADLDGDGKTDLIFQKPDGSVAAWLMNGTSSTSQVLLLGAGPWSVSHTGDLDGDGKTDLVLKHSDGSVAVWLMDGTVPKPTSATILGPGSPWSVAHVARLDGGAPVTPGTPGATADIVWRNVDGGTAVWLMSPTLPLQTVGTAALTGPGSDWTVTHTGDFDGDGRHDFLWRKATGETAIWLMDGITPTQSAVLFGDAAWAVTHLADFDGNGKSDVLWRKNTGDVAIWMMDGLGVTASSIVFSGPQWHVTHTRDLDGDGAADLIWRNSESGQTAAWLMNGLSVVGSTLISSDAQWTVMPMVAASFSCFATPPLAAGASASMMSKFGRLPLTFEANLGQMHPEVRFLARGKGFELFLTDTERVAVLRDAQGGGASVRMKFVGANERPSMAGVDVAQRKSHYLAGSRPESWKRNVSHFGKVRYEALYPGIDEVVYATRGRLEYDLQVAPGADPKAIRFALEGVDGLSLAANGDLLLETALGALVQKQPIAYQEANGERHPVDVAYRLLADNQVAFDLGPYDATHALVIDPVLVYSTYLGGTDNSSGANAIAVNACGEALIGGWTHATDFPTTAGAFDRLAVPGTMMGFVSKLNQSGTGLLFSTYITGSERDLGGGTFDDQFSEVKSLALDSAGQVHISGDTSATDFPVTPGAYITTPALVPTGFAAKLSVDGSSLLSSTYMPSSITAIAVDSSGNTYTGSDIGVVWKLNPGGTTLLYEFAVGGTGWGSQRDAVAAIAVDSTGSALVAGTTYSTDLPVTAGAFRTTKPNANGIPTGFVSRINTAGNGLAFGTYLGTAGSFNLRAMAVDAAGNIHVTGMADTNFSIPSFAGTPTTFTNNTIAQGSWLAIYAKLNASGSTLAHASRIGGSFCDGSCTAASTAGNAIATDGSGKAWITGTTNSNEFPLTKPLYSNYATPRNSPDIFVAKFVDQEAPASGTGLVFSTLLNGTIPVDPEPLGTGDSRASAIAVDVVGSAYIAGYTDKANFPTTPGALREGVLLGGANVRNAFVTKINESKDTATSLVASPMAGSVGGPTTLTATVTGSAPTGTVVFKDGTSSLGSVSLSGSAAQLVTSALGGGAHVLTAEYSGDAQNNPSASASLAYNVADPNTYPTISLSGIVDGAMLVTNSGNTFGGGSMNLHANAAPGNILIDVRVYYNAAWNGFANGQQTVDAVWVRPAYPVGSHVIRATATDQLNHEGSSTIRFVVNAAASTPPSVILSASSSSVVAGQTVVLTASVTPGSTAVTEVSFQHGSTGIGLPVTASPYVKSWTPTAAGTYSVVAVVKAGGDAWAVSQPVTITVTPAPPQPTVSLTAPAEGAAFPAPATISLSANAAAGGSAAITVVEFFNGSVKIGQDVSYPYAFVWNDVPPGTYALSAKATSNAGVSSPLSNVRTVTVMTTQPTVTVDAGIDGAVVSDETILVTGSVVAPPNSGVTINGRLATVTFDGRFFLNDVPLEPGANTVNIVVTTQDGLTGSQIVSATRSGTAPFKVTISNPAGFAPHTFSMKVEGTGAVGTIEFDLDEDGLVEYTATTLAGANVEFDLAAPAYTRIRVIVKSSGGAELYRTTRVAYGHAPLDLYNLVKGVYLQMVNRLKDNANNSALNLFMGNSRATHEQVFTRLGTDLPTFADQLGSILRITASAEIAEMVVVRGTGASTQSFMVYFIRGDDGIWRIESM